jgi:hypothetical protein
MEKERMDIGNMRFLVWSTGLGRKLQQRRTLSRFLPLFSILLPSLLLLKFSNGKQYILMSLLRVKNEF